MKATTSVTPIAREEGATSSGTVARAALLLRVLAEAEGDSSLSEIAQKMKLPVSTTHRLLGLLQVEGFVDRGDRSRTYRAGLEFRRLGGLVTSRAQLPDVAEQFMRAVVDASDETCMLSLYMPRSQSAMVAKVIYGKHPLRYEADLYAPTSLAWGATGRGILAFLPEPAIDQVLAMEEASPATGRKAPKPVQVKKELPQVREAGYAHSRGQKVPGAVGLAAPVFNASGVVGALCMTIPEARFDEARLSQLAHILMEQAGKFSWNLGHRGLPK